MVECFLLYLLISLIFNNFKGMSRLQYKLTVKSKRIRQIPAFIGHNLYEHGLVVGVVVLAMER